MNKRTAMAPAEPSDPNLERAIVEALLAGGGARDAFAVYGDWLQERGHPRGELVSAQLEGRPALVTQLFEANRTAFLGALVELEEADAKARAAREERYPAAQYDPLAPLFELDWHAGFLRGARIGEVGVRLEGRTIAEAVRALVALPSAKFLQALDIAPPRIHETGVEAELQEALAGAAFPVLRTLSMATGEQLSFTSAGDFAHLTRSAPALRTLHVRAGSLALSEPLDLRELEEIVLETCHLSIANVEALLASELPRLRKLVLWFGSSRLGSWGTGPDAVADLAAVMPLLDGALFPELEHLGLCNHDFGDALIEPLLASPLLARLESLDLSKGVLDDASVERLAAGARALAHLELDLSENYIATPARAKKLAHTVVGLDRQRDVVEDEERYAAIWE